MFKLVIALSALFGFSSLTIAAPQTKQNIQNKRIEKGVGSAPTKVKKRKYKSQKINLRKTKVQKSNKNNKKNTNQRPRLN